MSYKFGDDITAWLAMMPDIKSFGCATIPESELPLDEIKIGFFQYTASDEYAYVFTIPMKVDTRDLVLYAKGTYADGEVTILTTSITRTGFTVQAPIDCRVDFIIGYKND